MKKLFSSILLLLLGVALFGNEFNLTIDGRLVRFVEVENNDYSGALQKLTISEKDALRAEEVLIQKENYDMTFPPKSFPNLSSIRPKIGRDKTFICIMPADEYSTVLNVYVFKRVDCTLMFMSTRAQGSSFGDLLSAGADKANYLWNKTCDSAKTWNEERKVKEAKKAEQKRLDEQIGLFY